MSAAIVVTVSLTEINCGECGGVYAINERFRKQKEEKTGGWHCPYCDCSWGYFGKTEAQKERERRQQDEAREAELRTRLDQRDASIRALRGQATKLRKRASGGVCPCCNRTFTALGRHMATKHPDYSKQDIG